MSPDPNHQSFLFWFEATMNILYVFMILIGSGLFFYAFGSSLTSGAMRGVFGLKGSSKARGNYLR